MKKYSIRCSYTGVTYDEADTLAEAKKIIKMFIFEDIKQGCQYDRDYYEIYNNELEEVELLGEPIMLVIQLCRCGIIEDWDYIESIDAVDKFIKKHQAEMITDGQYYINYN